MKIEQELHSTYIDVLDTEEFADNCRPVIWVHPGAIELQDWRGWYSPADVKELIAALQKAAVSVLDDVQFVGFN